MDVGLMVGDLFILLSFALGGVVFHHVPGNPLGEVLRIGLPFIVGYLALGALLGALRWRPSLLSYAARGGLAWLLGMGAGFGLRALTSAGPPHPIFVQIAMTYTASLLLLWRGSYWLWRWRLDSRSPSP